MSSNEEPRRTKRTTAGVLPIRYRGDVSPVGQMPSENESSHSNPPSEVGSHHSEWRGSKSVRTASAVSSKDRREAEADREEKLNIITEQSLELEKQVQSIQIHLRAKQRAIDALQKKINSGMPSGSDLTTKLEELESDMERLLTDLDLANLDIEIFEKKKESRIRAINKRFGADADSDEGSLNSGDGVNQAAAIKDWINVSRANAAAEAFAHIENGSHANSDVNSPPSNVVNSSALVNQQQTNIPPASEPVAQTKDDLMLAVLQKTLENASINESRLRSHADRKLPAFNGDPAKWNIFLDAYERSTKKYQYDEAENVRRLQDCLFGDAERAVSHLLANPRNVPEILQVLQTRFGRPVLVINHCVNEVRRSAHLDLNNMQTIDSFGVKLNALVANICSFDMKEYLHNPTLLQELVNKLPRPWAQTWFEKEVDFGQKVPNLQDFRDWINRKIEAARRLDMQMEVQPARSEGNNWRRRQHGQLNNINTAAVRSPDKVFDRPCPCCHQIGHTLIACATFRKASVDGRWEIAKTARVCFCCLANEKAPHRIINCPQLRECGIDGCRSNHNRFLHHSEAPPALEENEVEELGHVGVIKGCDGPLPIIPVTIKGPKGVKQVYALLDTGATRSLIASEIADSVGLTGTRMSYRYSGICGKVIEEKNARKVSCAVSGIHNNASFFPLEKAVTVSRLPVPAYSFDLNKVHTQWPHLRGIRGKNLVNVVPSVIIGNDNPLLILANRVITGPPGTPVGWRTKLGWTVSGSFDADEKGVFNVACAQDMNRDLPSAEISQESLVSTVMPTTANVQVPSAQPKTDHVDPVRPLMPLAKDVSLSTQFREPKNGDKPPENDPALYTTENNTLLIAPSHPVININQESIRKKSTPWRPWERNNVLRSPQRSENIKRAANIITCPEEIPPLRSGQWSLPSLSKDNCGSKTSPVRGEKCRWDKPRKKQRQADKCASPHPQDATGRQVRKRGTVSRLSKHKHEKSKPERSSASSTSVREQDYVSDDYDFFSQINLIN